ncbi:hypothetical protein ACIGB6_15825 [Paeniglutamicibacter gangotriensis]|uniref:hypothetical protein n=1 Tax=Paeniglutamicibacter gangotriensis TaxID=254787 RepID=UPI0037CBD6A0
MTAITYRQALNDALRSELLRDENVILLGEEIGLFEGSYKITAGLLTSSRRAAYVIPRSPKRGSWVPPCWAWARWWKS